MLFVRVFQNFRIISWELLLDIIKSDLNLNFTNNILFSKELQNKFYFVIGELERKENLIQIIEQTGGVVRQNWDKGCVIVLLKGFKPSDELLQRLNKCGTRIVGQNFVNCIKRPSNKHDEQRISEFEDYVNSFSFFLNDPTEQQGE